MLVYFKAKGKEKKWNPAHYITFILHAGRGNEVELVDLGDAEHIDKAVAKLKKDIPLIQESKVDKALESSRNIYHLVFEPLRKKLGTVKEIFISPDGNLNLIPFEILQAPDGRYLIEDYTFNYLAAGRDVLTFGQIKEKGGKALLMGDPDFDLGAEERESSLSKLALSKKGEAAKRSADMGELKFTKLPGSREEVKAIQSILGKVEAEVYMGKKALEEVLRQKRAPGILHLATHFFS